MKTIEVTGRKLQDAINAGLQQLNATLDDVDIDIISNGGLFKKAKIKMTLNTEDEPVVEELKAVEKSIKEETEKKPVREEKKDKKPTKKEKIEAPKAQNIEEQVSAPVVKEHPVRVVEPHQVEIAQNYLTKLLELMKVDATLETDTTNGCIDIDIVTTDTTVIGHRGETLDALQILTKRAIECADDKFVIVNLDSQNYREKREKDLIKLAEKKAYQCAKFGKKIFLDPMNNTQRKVIHATLMNNENVITRSEGKEPNRRVVIIPKKKGGAHPYPKKNNKPKENVKPVENTETKQD